MRFIMDRRGNVQLKRWIVLLFCLLCLNIPRSYAAKQQAQALPAMIDGGDAGRVHLRAEPSVRSESLGLYFTGTELLCESDPTQEWTKVVIGSQEGYIKSEYLRWGEALKTVQPQQPQGTIRANDWVNMRSAPSKEARIETKLYEGDTVSILGETSGRWSYVKRGDINGYVLSKFLVVHKDGNTQTQFKEDALYYDQYLAAFPFEESGRAFYGIATIDAGADQSVHLRELDDDSSQSLGEYYNGTKVICVSDPSEPWVVVWIGNMIGCVHSDCLDFDAREVSSTQFFYAEMLEDAILSADPFSDTVPTFAGEEQVKKGQKIVLLGQTHNHHYFADTGEGWGYVRCESVKIVDGSSQE